MVWLQLRPPKHRESGEKKCEHRGPDCPALPAIACHQAKHVNQCRTEPENHEDFNEVAQWGRGFEWVRAVLPKKSATIRPELFDCDLRRNRSKWDLLRCAFKRRRRRIALEGLHDALLRQHDRDQDRQWQQNIERAAGEIGPEIPDTTGLLTHQSPRQRNRDGDAGCGAYAIVNGPPRP